MEQNKGERPKSDFEKMLDTWAEKLKTEGKLGVNLPTQWMERMVYEIVELSRGDMTKQGVAARINTLRVTINQGKASAETTVSASKDMGLFGTHTVDIAAKFGLENVLGPDGKPAGRLRTTYLNVTPESLFGGFVKPKEFLAPQVEGAKINDAFWVLLSKEMGTRGATATNFSLELTSTNMLHVGVFGGPKKK